MDRIFQIISSESHDYRKFTNGNIETLGGNASLREDLVEFYQCWYSANNMSLCVLGKGKNKFLTIIPFRISCNVAHAESTITCICPEVQHLYFAFYNLSLIVLRDVVAKFAH